MEGEIGPNIPNLDLFFSSWIKFLGLYEVGQKRSNLPLLPFIDTLERLEIQDMRLPEAIINRAIALKTTKSKSACSSGSNLLEVRNDNKWSKDHIGIGALPIGGTSRLKPRIN